MLVFMKFICLKLFSMSIHTPKDNTEWMTENLIQEARNLLEQEDEAINKMADTGIGTYYSIYLSLF